MPISFMRAAIVLGLLSVAGPIAIDTYLPALPAMTVDLQATAASMQMSLMAYFLAITLFQPVYGPISDMIGRRRPLFFGVALYTVAGLGCAFAPNVEVLIALRFVQGIGGCATMVIPRAIVRDLHTGVTAARLMALILLVFSVGPILAPLFGSLISEAVGWRAIFVAMGFVGLAGIAMIAVSLPETRLENERLSSSFGSALTSYAALLRDPRFLGIIALAGSALSGFFAFIAGSAFVYIDHYGLSPMAYSVAFSVNAIGFFTVAQFSGRIGARIGLQPMVRYAAGAFWLTSATLTAYLMAGGDSLPVLMGGLFATFAALGLVIPSTAVLALENYGRTAGTASALLGTAQFGFGAVAIGVVSAAGKGQALPMVATIAGFATLGLIMAHLVLPGREPVPAE